MNILNGIKNLLATTSPATSQAVSPRGYTTTSILPAADLDGFEKKFSAPPYFIGGRFRQGVGFDFSGDRPRINGKIWELIFFKAGGEGGIFSKSDKQKLIEISRQRKMIIEKQAQTTFSSVSRIYRERQEIDGSAFLRGDSQAIAPGVRAVQDGLDSTRKFLFQEEKRLSAEAFDIVQPACLLVRDAARLLVAQWDDTERKQHEVFNEDGDFSPSLGLRSLIFVGLESYCLPIKYFKGTGWMSAPPESNFLTMLYIPPPKPADPRDVRRQGERVLSD
jgi:hypothetical protein